MSPFDGTALAAELRRRLGRPPTLADPPMVSVIVVNRDGADHLRRLMAGLSTRTDYPSIELVLVDNGSSDESLELMRTVEAPFPISIVANPHNESFSDACNQGAELAGGSLLLFLNNDIEPFEDGWLRELVCCQAATGGGLVAATLLYPSRQTDGGALGYAVQHRGMRFRDQAGLIHPVLHDWEADPLDARLGEDVESPVVVAAAMLVGRDLFDRVGGFTRGYFYGAEDVDFGLKVRAAGMPVVCSGRSLLIHRPGSTRRTIAFEDQLARKLRNRRVLWERWGPRLRREYDLDALSDRGLWTEEGRRPADDAPSYRQALSLGFCLRDGASGAGGELVVALSDALLERDHRCLTLQGDDLDDPLGLNYDVAVHVRGACRYAPKPGQFNVLWCVSEMEQITRIECDRYELVATASRQLVDRLRGSGLRTPVAVLSEAEPRSRADQLIDATIAATQRRGLPLRIDGQR